MIDDFIEVEKDNKTNSMKRPGQLPSIQTKNSGPAGSKFSSWNNNEDKKVDKKTEPDDNNFMDEVDELLLE